MLIGYLYGITSERKLVEELRMHLAWRWFTGLGFDQEIPHHSTFSKNRHGRFQESKLFEQLFEQIVKQCVKVGLIQGKHLSVDGSFVEANAAKGSRIPREQLVEAAQVHHTVRKYLQELEQQNPAEEPVHQQEQVSTTDPDSTYATKGGTPARLGYYDNYLVDNHSCVIVGVQATALRKRRVPAVANGAGHHTVYAHAGQYSPQKQSAPVRVAHLIEKECGVRYHAGHAWRILRQLGWSCQRPTGRALERDEEKIRGRALERDEEKIRVWKQKRWPELKKTPKTRAARSSSSTKAD